MSSIKTTQIDGDVSVGRNVAIGGKARVAGSATIGHNLKVEGWLEAPNIKDINNKGLFASSSALEAAYPTPRVGWWAMIGDSSPFAIYRCNSAGTWTATGGTASVSLTIDAETIAGWVSISSMSELPEDPTDDERGKGYLLGTVLYVYVGTGGDTLDGLYQSAQLKGQKGDTGNTVQLGEAVIADNLTTDDAEKVLSAKQGKVLKGLIDNIEIPVVNDLTTGGEGNALSAEMGKILGQAMSLVVDILKSGVYTADKSAEIEELENMFDNYVDVTKSLTNVSVSPDVSTAAKGTSLTLTFTPSASHVIDAVTVTMGGVSQTVTIAQDQKSATCAIVSVSGNIEIVASASYVEQDLIDSATKLTGSGVIYASQGVFGTSSDYDCFIVPLEFGKWYRLSGYDWAAKSGTKGGFNLALVKSDGNGGFENIKTTELTSTIFGKNNTIWTIGGTNNNIYMQTGKDKDLSTYMFATPTSSELSGVNDIYLAVNIRFASVDISDDVSLFTCKPKEIYSADDVVKYYGLIYPLFDLSGSDRLYYDCVVIKATKGATYFYSGDNWSAQSGNGAAFAIGLAKGVGDLYDNLTASDFASGASWLSNDSFFNHTANIFKASVAESGQFTIPTDADLASTHDIYIVINTRFDTVDVLQNLTLTKQ